MASMSAMRKMAGAPGGPSSARTPVSARPVSMRAPEPRQLRARTEAVCSSRKPSSGCSARSAARLSVGRLAPR